MSAANLTGPSLRDYFAAAALSGLCANPGGPFQASAACGWAITNCAVGDIAKTAYDCADSMLSARPQPSAQLIDHIEDVYIIKGRGLVVQVPNDGGLGPGDVVSIRARIAGVEKSLESGSAGLVMVVLSIESAGVGGAT